MGIADGNFADGATIERSTTGLILGNLSFPTDSMSALSEEMVSKLPKGSHRVHPSHRFMSGRPALLAKKALGLGGAAWALDCACASGLIAIQQGCEALTTGRMDASSCWGVNRADDLFIHMGFTVSQALSQSGRSQPFSADADGLVPAEGAGFVAAGNDRQTLCVIVMIFCGDSRCWGILMMGVKRIARSIGNTSGSSNGNVLTCGRS